MNRMIQMEMEPKQLIDVTKVIAVVRQTHSESATPGHRTGALDAGLKVQLTKVLAKRIARIA
ncbi:MAG: hypothetical protein EOO38_14520 [Cytophagaceae bacterium]|nr:MAG: hypothetical protein EOO38_14520 [Cytophagaceae bacterium]